MLKICSKYEYDDILEEVAFDLIMNDDTILISNFQIGENYLNIDHLNTIADSDLTNVYFNHEKIYEDLDKRILNLKLKNKFLYRWNNIFRRNKCLQNYIKNN